MSINWDVSKIEDFEKKFPDHVDADGTKHWNGKFDCIIYYAWFTEFGAITEKNYEELYTRILMWDTVNGCLSQVVEDGKATDYPLTLQDVKDAIGLWINVNYETMAHYQKKLSKALLEEAKRKTAKAVKDQKP